MTITVVDANILIASMDKNDAHHRAVVRHLASAIQTDRLCIPVLNLAEALVAQARRDRGLEAEAAIAATGIEVVSSDPVSALELATLRATTGLKLPDCLLLASALALGATLATTDKALASQATKLGVVLALPDGSGGSRR